jgi:nitrogenase iron protein NifH
VLYDVLGDVVCGGFAVPIRNGLTNRIYVVSSQDFMAIYAANNLFKCIAKYATSGGALLGGVIGNNLFGSHAEELITDFAKKTNSAIIDFVPKSLNISQSELHGKTVVEAAPDSKEAEKYRAIANKIATDSTVTTPNPMDVISLRDWARAWGDKILKERTHANYTI